jgi:hypothetical protein
MAIVLPCTVTAHDYAAALPDLNGRPACPDCSEPMSLWGSYRRALRLEEEDLQIRVRRARCSSCRVSHGLVPEFVTLGRLDGVEVIGTALEEIASGSTIAAAAARPGVPSGTVRGWLRRLRDRADLLARGFLAALVALGCLVPRLSGSGNAIETALSTARAAAAELARRSGGGRRWHLANRIVGGHLLSTNTDPPWICA